MILEMMDMDMVHREVVVFGSNGIEMQLRWDMQMRNIYLVIAARMVKV